MKKQLFAALALLIFAIPFVFWVVGLAPAPTLPVLVYDVGRLCALVAFVLIFFQYLLSAKIKWIERGIGLDRLLKTHKGSGVIVLCLVLAHPLLMNLSERWQGFSSPFHVFKLLGLVALCILVISGGTAFLYEPLRLKYETWKSLHKAIYALYPLAFSHSFIIGGTVQKGPVWILWAFLQGGSTRSASPSAEKTAYETCSERGARRARAPLPGSMAISPRERRGRTARNPRTGRME